MIYIFMSSVISMILVMMRVRDYESFKEKIREHEKSCRQKIKKTKVPFFFYMQNLAGLLGVVAVMIFVYAYSTQIKETGVNLAVSLAVCLISLFVANLLWERWKVRLYYDEEGFFIKHSYFRFKNVKEIMPLNKRNQYGLVLYNGRTVKVSSVQAKQIEMLIKK